MTEVRNRVGALAGPLTVSATNPRYFDDGSGGAIFLAGAYPQNMQQASDIVWSQYLGYLDAHPFSYFKWMHRNRVGSTTAPIPYARHASECCAADGLNKVDFDLWNDAYWTRLRSRVLDLDARGIYFSYIFFQGWDIRSGAGSWEISPFKSNNNANGIDGDPGADGDGLETQEMALPSGVEAIHRAYIRKVIDTLNDLDNVIWEVANEMQSGGTAAQAFAQWVADEIHTYEASQPKQHLVGISDRFVENTNLILSWSQTDYMAGPSEGGVYPGENNGPKPIIADSDHLNPDNMTVAQAWEAFTRGNHAMSIEQGGGLMQLHLTTLHDNMAQMVAWSQQVHLVGMSPQSGKCSSGRCLLEAGVDYIVFVPGGGSFTLDLSGAAASNLFSVEYYNTATGATQTAASVSGGDSAQSFTCPGGSTACALKLQKQ